MSQRGVSKKSSKDDHSSMYKTKSRGIGDRLVRGLRFQEERQQSRMSEFDKRRRTALSPLQTENQASNVKETIEMKEDTVLATKEKKVVDKRREMLKKWREEKLLRKKADEMEKSRKKPFVVKHVTHPSASVSVAPKLTTEKKSTNVLKKTGTKNGSSCSARTTSSHVTRASTRLANKAVKKQADVGCAIKAKKQVIGNKMATRSTANTERQVAASVKPTKPHRKPTTRSKSKTEPKVEPPSTETAPADMKQTATKDCPKQASEAAEVEPNHTTLSSIVPTDFSFKAPVGVDSFKSLATSFKFKPLTPGSAAKFMFPSGSSLFDDAPVTMAMLDAKNQGQEALSQENSLLKVTKGVEDETKDRHDDDVVVCLQVQKGVDCDVKDRHTTSISDQASEGEHRGGLGVSGEECLINNGVDCEVKDRHTTSISDQASEGEHRGGLGVNGEECLVNNGVDCEVKADNITSISEASEGEPGDTLGVSGLNREDKDNDDGMDTNEATEDQHISVSVDLDAAAADGATAGPYFRGLAETETKKLQNLCCLWKEEIDGENSPPEEVEGLIRTAVGQVQLLVTKKFKQFRGLIDISEDPDAKQKTLQSDLQGFWEMIYFQVEDIERKFKKLEELKMNNWEEVKMDVKKVAKKTTKKIARKPRKTGAKAAETRNKFREMRAQMKVKIQEETSCQEAFKMVLTPVKNKNSRIDQGEAEVVLTPLRRSTRTSLCIQPKIVSTPKDQQNFTLRLTPTADEEPSCAEGTTIELKKPEDQGVNLKDAEEEIDQEDFKLRMIATADEKPSCAEGITKKSENQGVDLKDGNEEIDHEAVATDATSEISDIPVDTTSADASSGIVEVTHIFDIDVQHSAGGPPGPTGFSTTDVLPTGVVAGACATSSTSDESSKESQSVSARSSGRKRRYTRPARVKFAYSPSPSEDLPSKRSCRSSTSRRIPTPFAKRIANDINSDDDGASSPCYVTEISSESNGTEDEQKKFHKISKAPNTSLCTPSAPSQSELVTPSPSKLTKTPMPDAPFTPTLSERNADVTSQDTSSKTGAQDPIPCTLLANIQLNDCGNEPELMNDSVFFPRDKPSTADVSPSANLIFFSPPGPSRRVCKEETICGSVRKFAPVTPSKKLESYLGTSSLYSPVRRSVRIEAKHPPTSKRPAFVSLSDVPDIDYGYVPNKALINKNH